MGRRDEGAELTVYISNNEAEFRRVEEALRTEGVRYRVWTTAEYPVFGWTRWDPRLIGRRESRLRKVYHIEVTRQDRQNLIAANKVIRSVTGKMFNAEPINEII
jgi:hypothetical protein